MTHRPPAFRCGRDATVQQQPAGGVGERGNGCQRTVPDPDDEGDKLRDPQMQALPGVVAAARVRCAARPLWWLPPQVREEHGRRSDETSTLHGRPLQARSGGSVSVSSPPMIIYVFFATQVLTEGTGDLLVDQ